MQNDITEKIIVAENFINKSYMNELNKYSALPLKDYEKKDNLIRLYKIKKIVFSNEKTVDEQLISVIHSVMPFCNNFVFIIKGTETYAELYIGVKSSIVGNAAVAINVLHDTFIGNFPGTQLEPVATSDIIDVFCGLSHSNSVAALNMIPSERDKSKDFVQGLEKFIDTMKGYEYTVEIMAAPKSADEVEERKSGYEDIYTALSPFAKETNSHGVNISDSVTEGISDSISKSISRGISKTFGTSDGHTSGRNSGSNVGMHLLLSFGTMSGKHEDKSTSINKSDTSSDTSTSTDSFTHQSSSTRTEGTSDNITIEYRNKSVEGMLEKIDNHLERIKQGASYGLWETVTFFIADRKTAAMAAGVFSALLSGDKSGFENKNLNFFDLKDSKNSNLIDALRYCQLPVFDVPMASVNGTEIEFCNARPCCYVNSRELALLINLPKKSISGINVVQIAEFGRNTKKYSEGTKTISIGKIQHMGELENVDVKLDINSLTGHCFVTGSTGSGKSNTVYRLIEKISLEDYKIPFLVIEPAKGEYRDEFRKVENINLFSTNPLVDQMLKINPFSFCEEIHILEHLDRLVEIFNGCWEMYAAMPAILKEAIEKAYVEKGWDLINSVYVKDGVVMFPTFSDVLEQLPKIINSSQYSSETKGDYIGALVTRVNSMTNGIYGQIFCDETEVSNEELFDQNTVIDISRVGSSETKALIMGIVILKLTEYRMAKAKSKNSDLRHITILEEAHNILKNSKDVKSSAGGGNVVAKSVEMIVNSIAEMRTYGEGFIIVDQSPTSVDIAAIKNTNTKIVMRLPEKGDCDLAGRSVSLNENQIKELSKLSTGVAVVMQNNWDVPVLCKIDKANHKNYLESEKLSYPQIKKLRSELISEIIEQFIISDNADTDKIYKLIDVAEISDYKKPEFRRIVKQLSERINGEFDSQLMGNIILNLAGCDDVFNNSERYLEYDEPDESDIISRYTDTSINKWLKHIESYTKKYLSIDEELFNTAMQYIIYAKQFENHSISYNLLYNQIYNGIR